MDNDFLNGITSGERMNTPVDRAFKANPAPEEPERGPPSLRTVYSEVNTPLTIDASGICGTHPIALATILGEPATTAPVAPTASRRHVAVSLPYAAQLIDGKKYMLPGDVKPPEGGTERRRQRAPRAPSMRTLVRWAQKCDSAEQLGERLKRRYDRQLQRRGLAPPAMPAPRPNSIDPRRANRPAERRVMVSSYNFKKLVRLTFKDSSTV